MVELSGRARGGDGASYGGDTVIAMNVTGSLVLSGQFRGGDVSAAGERPGAAVLLLDAQTAEHTSMNNAQLEDGQILPPLSTATPEPTVEPTPEPTQTPEPTDVPTPAPTEAPADESDAQDATPGEATAEQDADAAADA